MLRFAPVLSATLLVAALAAQQAPVVLPPSCQQADGRSGGDWPGFTQRLRMQVLLGDQALTGLRNRSLQALAVRRDGQYLAAHAGGRAQVVVVASHAAVAPHAAAASFANNRGSDAREVFRGEVDLPNAPALAHRDAISWQAPHAVEFPFSAPFAYQSGALCLDIDGAPVAGAAAPWWRIDYDLFTHDAQLAGLGQSCDPKTSATASRESLVAGGTLRLIGVGPVGAVGFVALDGATLSPPWDLTPIGAPGCALHVLPTVLVGTAYQSPAVGGYGPANVRLQLPTGSDLLGARLATQWLAYPNPIHPGQLSVTNALTMQVASSVPNLAGAIVRTGPVFEPAPLPDFGDVHPNTVPVVCLRAP